MPSNMFLKCGKFCILNLIFTIIIVVLYLCLSQLIIVSEGYQDLPEKGTMHRNYKNKVVEKKLYFDELNPIFKNVENKIATLARARNKCKT